MHCFSRFWFRRFSERMHSPSLLPTSRLAAFPKAFSRNRKLNFLSTLLTILDVGRESSSLKLHRVLDRIRGTTVSVTQQAFSKARNQISHQPFKTLFEQQIEDEYHGGMGRLPFRSADGWTYLVSMV